MGPSGSPVHISAGYFLRSSNPYPVSGSNHHPSLMHTDSIYNLALMSPLPWIPTPYILGVQAAQWAVLQLIYIHHSWQDSTDNFGRNNNWSPAFPNLMAELAMSCEWMLKSDCFNCCTSHFRSSALNFRMFIKKRKKLSNSLVLFRCCRAQNLILASPFFQKCCGCAM